MKNISSKFFERKKTHNNNLYKRISVILFITILVLTISHVYNIKNLEAKAQDAYEKETRSIEIYLDGEFIGELRSDEVFDEILFEIKETLKNKEGMDIKIINKIDVVDSHAEDVDLTAKNTIINKLRGQLKYDIVVHGIEVDGEIIGKLPSKKMAEELIEDIKEPYYEMTKNSDYVEVELAQEVNIKEIQASKDELNDYDDLLYYIQKGTNKEETHVVEKGENYWTISKKYNISISDIKSANPDINPDLIHPGDELSLVIPKPFIGVKTKEVVMYEQNVAYETEYEKVSWLYNDEYQTKRKGEYGVAEVKAEIIKENGIEISRNIIEEKIIDEPVKEILYNGVKEPPPKKGTGYFIDPLPTGYVSSRYGPRWSSYHYALDIASTTGTPVKAADGGVVIFSGWSGDYGYLVEIDHGGGFTTRYAHNSKIFVSVGEKVYQGQKISAVGETGYTTGPHVHFEVRKYGSPVNPSEYINKQYR